MPFSIILFRVSIIAAFNIANPVFSVNLVRMPSGIPISVVRPPSSPSAYVFSLRPRLRRLHRVFPIFVFVSRPLPKRLPPSAKWLRSPLEEDVSQNTERINRNEISAADRL